MSKPTPSLLNWFGILAAFLSLLSATESLFAQGTQPTPPPKAPARIKFRPPATGAPAVRVTGGSRGSGITAVTLDVLAPDQAGLTIQEQPSLFWYQSQPSEAKFELTLLRDNQVEPVFQFTLPAAAKAGIQRLRLSDHKAKLASGVEYQWVVALVLDPQNRSRDLVASGVIKRVEPSPDLKLRITQAAPVALPSVFADAGIWYDTLSALSDEIEAHPDDKTPRQDRADLLRQIGLPATAASETATVPVK
jgi:hypothetical protein